jgi:hypothetical protein
MRLLLLPKIPCDGGECAKLTKDALGELLKCGTGETHSLKPAGSPMVMGAMKIIGSDTY